MLPRSRTMARFEASGGNYAGRIPASNNRRRQRQDLCEAVLRLLNDHMWQRTIKTHISPWTLNHFTGTVGSCNTQPRNTLTLRIYITRFEQTLNLQV